jgi:hypothetical protein
VTSTTRFQGRIAGPLKEGSQDIKRFGDERWVNREHGLTYVASAQGLRNFRLWRRSARGLSLDHLDLSVGLHR